jgi:hypothetical protein
VAAARALHPADERGRGEGVTELPSSAAPVQVRRPPYLVLALFAVWMVGFFGASEGCRTVDVLHRPGEVRAALSHITDVQLERRQEALVDTTLAFRTIVTPLAVGQVLLASLLTLTTGLTLLGRRRLRRVALQAMLAYSVFLPIDHLVRAPVRAHAIDAMTSDTVLHPLAAGEAPSRVELRAAYLWAYRSALGLQLAVLAMGAFALTRPRVRAFFAAIREPARTQEP